MAEFNSGKRDTVQDPLASTAQAAPARTIPMPGISAPNVDQTGVANSTTELGAAMGGIEKLVANQFEDNKTQWITEGKMAYVSGKTEAEMLQTGNRYTAAGYHTLQSKDAVDQWFTNQTIAVDQDQTVKSMDPAAYQDGLKKQAAKVLGGIQDPDAKRVAAASFEATMPRLVQSQLVKNNEFNRGERVNSFSTMLSSTATTSATASVQKPTDPIAVSPDAIAPPLNISPIDRDTGIRTMIGEAAREGGEGQAAVAHVLRNRASDPRWPSSIAEVAKQPKQFSAWNAGAGGNSLVNAYKPGDPIYERAGFIFDTVMAGKHVDPTGGATHYYSPAGMAALVRDGSQTNLLPKWLGAEQDASGGQIKIGGHVFVGKSDGTQPTQSGGFATTTGISSGTASDLNAVPASDEGVKAPAIPHGPNEALDLINNYKGLNDQDKATAVADAMRRGLVSGDDKLFRDAGGIGILQKLKAKPSEIDEVTKAKIAFDKKQETNYSASNETFKDETIREASEGGHLPTILAKIDKRVKDHLLIDADARGLAATAAEHIRAYDKNHNSVQSNPDYQNEVGQLYQQAKTGADFKTIVEQGKVIAAKYGAKDDDIQKMVMHMAALDQTYKDKLRADATTAAATAAEQKKAKADVDRTLANGRGLGALPGSTKITVKNDRGQDEDVSMQEYGVMQIKDKWGKYYSDQVQSQQMDPAAAKFELVKKVSLELQNHGVHDDKGNKQISSALVGNLLDEKQGGGIRKDALEAYDHWLMMRKTPQLGDAYMSGVIEDGHVRSLLETAYKLNSGNLNAGQALITAHDLLNDPNRDVSDVIKKNALWDAGLKAETTKALDTATDPGFWNKLFGNRDTQDAHRIDTARNVASNFLTRQADSYHTQHPNETVDVSLTKASQDLKARSTHVMGNLLIGRPGLELPTSMGVQDMGATAADDAVRSHLEKYGERYWPTEWKGNHNNMTPSFIDKRSASEGEEGVFHAIGRNILESGGNPLSMTKQQISPVHITYNAEAGTIAVDLYKDVAKGEVLGDPKILSVKDIGAAYIKKQTTPGTWDTMWAGMFKGAVQGVRDAPANLQKARDNLATPTDAPNSVKSGLSSTFLR